MVFFYFVYIDFGCKFTLFYLDYKTNILFFLLFGDLVRKFIKQFDYTSPENSIGNRCKTDRLVKKNKNQNNYCIRKNIIV